jgi:hypothetical protein
MKIKTQLITAACIAAIVFGASFNAAAKEKKSASPTPSAMASASPAAEEKPARPIAYRGKIASVDATAKTFTVGSRTIKVTDETKIMKQGATATMTDIVADEEVRGSYWKKEDGSLEAKSVKLGAMTEEEKAKRSSRKKKSEESAEASPSASPKP